MNRRIDTLIKAWLFPARLVQTVTAFGWFLTSKPTIAGSSGFSVVVLAALINITIHLVLAIFGVSYWELCHINVEVEPIYPYLFVNLIIGIPLFSKYIQTDECIEDLCGIHRNTIWKLLSLIVFFLFVIGAPTLNYFVAMWTLDPWY